MTALPKLTKDQIIGLVSQNVSIIDSNVNKLAVEAIVNTYISYCIGNLIHGHTTELFEAFTLTPAGFDAYFLGEYDTAESDLRGWEWRKSKIDEARIYAQQEGMKVKYATRSGYACKRKNWFLAAVKSDVVT
jgi:hypothetical protein